MPYGIYKRFYHEEHFVPQSETAPSSGGGGGGGELGNFHRAPNELKGAARRCKGVFIIYTRDWYRREMDWISHFSGV